METTETAPIAQGYTPEVTESPELAAEGENLRNAASEHGIIGVEPLEESAPETPEVAQPDKEQADVVKPEASTDNPETKPEAPVEVETAKGKRLKDPKTGKFVKADGSPDPEQPDKETAYAKAQKEAERRDRSWKALEAEKQQVRTQAQLVAQQQAALQQKFLAQQNAARLSPDGKHTYTAQEYASAANEFADAAKKARTEGDEETAQKNEELAERAAQAAQETYDYEIKSRQEHARQQFVQNWSGQMEAAIKDEPDLANPESALSKETQRLLGEEKIFGVIVDGFKKAAQVAKLSVEAGLVPGLKEENTKLKAEVERLNKALGIKGSGPTQATHPKRADDMSVEELGRELRRASEEAGELVTGIAA